MTKKEYVEYLKAKSNEKYGEIEILKMFKDFLEDQLSKYEEEITDKENEIEEINIELNDLEDYVWGNPEESQNAYMNDVL